MKSVVDRMMAPQDVYILVLGTCEYLTSHGERDVLDVIKDLKVRLSWIIRWAQCHHKSPCSRKAGG